MLGFCLIEGEARGEAAGWPARCVCGVGWGVLTEKSEVRWSECKKRVGASRVAVPGGGGRARDRETRERERERKEELGALNACKVRGFLRKGTVREFPEGRERDVCQLSSSCCWFFGKVLSEDSALGRLSGARRRSQTLPRLTVESRTERGRAG